MMKKRKIKKSGFTLIEILDVLIVLSIIFVLVFPNILNHFKKAENVIDDATKKILVDATKDYMNENFEDYKLNNKVTYCIKIEDLINNNMVLEKQLSNMNDINQYVKVSYDNSLAVYEISKNCIPNIDSTFVLNGEAIVKVKLDDYYEELGVKALDENYNDISSTVTTTIYNSAGEKVDSVDTSIVETYIIKYKLNILDIYSKQIEREVRIMDDIAPVITIDLLDDNFDDTVSSYDILSKISITDNSGEIITPVIKTNLSLGVPGTYKININATDSSGNKSTVSKQIQIYGRDLSYSASISCSDGRTLDENNNCIYNYVDNVEKCGCKTHASCPTISCGVETYKNCVNNSCDPASYNTCNHSLCPTYTTTECTKMNYYWGYQCSNGCVCESMDANSCCGGSCPGSSGGGTVFKHWAACAATSTTTSRPPCAIKECGVASYQSCRNSVCGVETYKSCVDDSCECSEGNTCTLTENNYKIYTCPNGGTLNGTICEM